MARRNAGFTLVEVMITVVILTILGMVAVPAYFGFLQESRRSEAHTALLALAAAQEQWYANNNTYTADITDLLAFVPAQVVGQTNYTYQVTAADNSTFTLQADAQAAQAGDAACTAITLNEQGSRMPVACWVQ